MAGPSKDYSPADIFMDFANIKIDGYAKGTFVKVSYDEDAFTDEVGAAGDMTRVHHPSKAGTVVFTLMGASATNDLLSALHLADRGFKGVKGSGIGTLNIRDGMGTTVHIATQAWIIKMAEWTAGDAQSNREWTIRCADLAAFVGGNN